MQTASKMMVRPALGNALTLSLLVVVTFWLYRPGIEGPLLLDDYASVKPLLKPIPFADWGEYLISPTGPLGRPVSMASFLLNSTLGRGELRDWKLTNLALHGLVGILLFGVSRRIFALTGSTSDSKSDGAALLVAALWLVHPLQPSTVLYVVQRMTQLSALFTLGGFYLYLKTRTSTKPAGISLWLPYLICTPLAALSKETGLLLPAFFALAELTILHEVGSRASQRQAVVLLLLFLIAPMAVGIFYLVTNFESAIWNTHLRRGFTLWERLMTESRVLALYIRQILFPSYGQLGFFHDDIKLSTSFWSPPLTLPSIVGHVLLLASAWKLRRRARIVSFGIGWFYVGHALESTIFPLELMFEHRNYLPSLGVIVGAVGVWQLWFRRESRLLSASVALSMLALSCWLTSTIVRDWNSEATMYAAFYKAHPTSPTAASQMAELLMTRGRFEPARAVLQKVEGVGPEIHRWFLECREHRMLDTKTLPNDVLTRERILSTYAVTGIIEIANLRLDNQCTFSLDWLDHLLKAAIAMPMILESNRHKLMIYRAHVAWKANEADEAFAILEDVLHLQPADPMPALLQAEWRLERGDRDQAWTALRKAERIAAKSRRDYSAEFSSIRAALTK